ncbi:stearoyl-CoA desaturase [Melanomma pulvis-pyrius CBS 109.77]|uniref:Acyl-CoA desaturase n=1 Tax=Melanomma pulvis-pyrius CBS 109.77 TaxID=1314802 RepID=A0A6A6X5Q1_9PLEO|nr:stearoyl-CoA desaturase [Melanomma pulvis-pyrius CBS 109.77]
MPASKETPKPKLHISEQPITLRNFHRHVNWLHATVVILFPLVGCVLAFYTPLQTKTFIWAVVYYFCTGFGITAGYHRLWSHRCYSAKLPLRLLLAAAGAGAIQGSIRWWSSKHRAHHRWTDTIKDPYSVQKGFNYSHMGWILMEQNPQHRGRTDISDLDHDPVVVWQHRHFGKCMLIFAWVFPMLVAGLWGDWWGGLLYAGVLRGSVVQQATFCVNSLAHWLGEQPFDDRNSPRDHFLTALVTLGEGYHNFHHEFPSDYRNAISWYQYDPTKWLIYALSKTGIAYDLKKFRYNEIEKGRLQQSKKTFDKKYEKQSSKLSWGTPLSDLPVIEWDDFKSAITTKDSALVAIGGVIHNVAAFILEHPGGKSLISSAIGKDATAMFNGGVYEHSNAAHNILSTMRVGILRGGAEVEIWKRETCSDDKVIMGKCTRRTLSQAGGSYCSRCGEVVRVT